MQPATKVRLHEKLLQAGRVQARLHAHAQRSWRRFCMRGAEGTSRLHTGSFESVQQSEIRHRHEYKHASFLHAAAVSQMQPRRRRMHAKALAAFGCMRMHTHAPRMFACSGRDADAGKTQAHARKTFGGFRVHGFCMSCTVDVAGSKRLYMGAACWPGDRMRAHARAVVVCKRFCRDAARLTLHAA
jgi:hypothetical protein